MLEEKVPSILLTDDPLERLNKAMALFRSAISLRFPPATIQKGKVDMGKAFGGSLVVIESSETKSEKQDTSSRSGNDADAYNADIRTIHDEAPMAEVQLTTECNIFDTGHQHTEQPKIIIEGLVIYPFMHVIYDRELLSLSCDFAFRTEIFKSLFLPLDCLAAFAIYVLVQSLCSTFHHLEILLTLSLDRRDIFEEDLAIARFSPNTTSTMYEKTSPRSDLRWKPTGRIFEYVGLRWIPTGKLFDSYTSKVDNEPPHSSNVDIPHIPECKQTLAVRVGTSINVQKEQSLDLSAGTLCNVNKENLRVWLLKRLISQTPLSKWIHR
ncbi:hypothetical protein Tco_0398314 [Tanacetum coccineum]